MTAQLVNGPPARTLQVTVPGASTTSELIVWSAPPRTISFSKTHVADSFRIADYTSKCLQAAQLCPRVGDNPITLKSQHNISKSGACTTAIKGLRGWPKGNLKSRKRSEAQQTSRWRQACVM